MNHRDVLAYQMAAADGATHAGMVVLVYDGLARDLIQAAQAARQNNIERRCIASEHAMLLVGHLEQWVELVDDSRLAAGLRDFYAMLRTRILQVQASAKPADFEDLAQLVCDTRAAWQAKEQTSRNTEHRKGSVHFITEEGSLGSKRTSISPAALSFSA